MRAAVANAMTQGLAVATGLQEHFDWKGVATSAIGAGVGSQVSQGLGSSASTGEQVFKAGLTGLAAGTATALARGGRVSVQQIATDAFGNALGASLGQQIRQGGQQEDRLGDFINEQEAAQTQRDMAAAKTSFRQSEIAYQNETESAPSSMGGGSGLRLGGGGIGIRLPSSAVKDWSDGIGGGIMLNGSMAPAEQRRALRTYTVQPGDNPASIGVKFFGDSRAGATILADNGLDASVRGARNLPVGTVLTLRDDISEGNLRAGGRLIGADTSIRAQERAAVAEAQARADQAREEALRMGAWSGRTNQLGSAEMTTGTTSRSAAISDNSLLGATAGVAASFGEMAAGAARIGSNMIMQVGDILTGGYNHDHPVMQQVWAEQRALGAGIVNAVTSPVTTATNLIEGTVSRYDNALAQGSNFDRSYELGKLFNDVGQGAIGAGSALRGAARLGVSGLEFVGENAFTGPAAGSMAAQRGAVTVDLLTGGFVTEEKLGFGKLGPTNFTEMYRTRPAYEVAALRAEFGGLKGSFMREFAESPEAAARMADGEFTARDIANMSKGRVPVDYDIHHKLPLFRGGDNSFSNFDLMKNTYHETNRFDLHYYTPGKNPYGLNPNN